MIHRRDDVTVAVEAGRLLAKRIPNATYVELLGADHLPMVGENPDRILDEIEPFLTGTRRSVMNERILATVLFTDIVDSTRRAAELGDRRWRDLLDRRYHLVREKLRRYRGREIETAGDGFFTTFDGPANVKSLEKKSAGSPCISVHG